MYVFISQEKICLYRYVLLEAHKTKVVASKTFFNNAKQWRANADI